MKHLSRRDRTGDRNPGIAAGLAQDKTVVSFLHKFPEPENMAYFDAAVAEFEAANPTIDIVMEAVADEPYKDKIRVLMASDQVPDIYFSWSGEFGRKFAREGRTLDLTEALKGRNGRAGSPPPRWSRSSSRASSSHSGERRQQIHDLQQGGLRKARVGRADDLRRIHRAERRTLGCG